jgi:hypothetical protein
MEDRELALFLRWLLKHYSTATKFDSETYYKETFEKTK